MLLADEPTGNLDAAAGAEVLRLLRAGAAEGRAVVMVTHEAAAAEIADRVLTLRDGRLQSDADPRRARGAARAAARRGRCWPRSACSPRALVVGTATTVGYSLATGFDRSAERADLPDVIARFARRSRAATVDARVRALPNLAGALLPLRAAQPALDAAGAHDAQGRDRHACSAAAAATRSSTATT